MSTSTGLEAPAPKRPTRARARARARARRKTITAAAAIPNTAGHSATASTGGDIEGAQRLLTSYLAGNRSRTLNDSLLDFFAWGKQYVAKAARPAKTMTAGASR